ncbi:hypothetical protein E2C01_090748 [Portunus trituberculatus]|uniref:Uncharacterized protein n=1 Tax=Portunus trituberculatus TaxID=210409 RepID=A0A5B7JHF4_PORTR|nr:hypothetical protein [Portunus trituberculatus]
MCGQRVSGENINENCCAPCLVRSAFAFCRLRKDQNQNTRGIQGLRRDIKRKRSQEEEEASPIRGLMVLQRRQHNTRAAARKISLR